MNLVIRLLTLRRHRDVRVEPSPIAVQIRVEALSNRITESERVTADVRRAMRRKNDKIV